jgi:hypothetical protein
MPPNDAFNWFVYVVGALVVGAGGIMLAARIAVFVCECLIEWCEYGTDFMVYHARRYKQRRRD